VGLTRRIFVLISIVVSCISVGCGSSKHAADGVAAKTDLGNSNVTVTDLQQFRGYDVYWLGPRHDSLPLAEIVSVHTETEVAGADDIPPQIYVSLQYGTCDASPQEEGGDSGCYPPIEVQTWRACSRNRSLYELGMPPGKTSRNYTMTKVRGVPAAIFSDMVEVYTGDETVVLFGRPADALSAVGHLIAVNPADGAAIAPGDALPPPVPGALKGKLTGRC